MSELETAMNTLRQERATSKPSQKSLEDPCTDDIEGDTILSRETTGGTVVTPQKQTEIHLGGGTPGQSLPQPQRVELYDVWGGTTTVLGPHVTYVESPDREATGCTVAMPKPKEHKENSQGGCTPRETLTLTPDIALGNVAVCTPDTPEPGQKEPVGCTTVTFPSYVDDSLQSGTVGCTTVTPMSLSGVQRMLTPQL